MDLSMLTAAKLASENIFVKDFKVISQFGQDPEQILFRDILLYLTNVVDRNVAMLHECGHPIATIKAVHTGANAAKVPPDDAGGLEPFVILARTARVMLTSKLWVEVQLVNGAMGTVEAICYKRDKPPIIPVAVMAKFDYTGPTVHDGTLPITVICCNWSSSCGQCSRLQLPLKVALAVTIHKSQVLTMNKVVSKL
uniref:ATP-dependent DNA helicase n=1 Tax=Amphimedon queenslandica TaxID=400682 RepID=A0A1X7UJP8_AMPQE